MGNHTKVKKNSELRERLSKRMHKKVKICLGVGFFVVGCLLWCDICKGFCAGNFVDGNSILCRSIRELQSKLLADIDKYCNLIMALNSVPATIVAFFYSIQDSKRGGIPHRTIMAYAFGSFTVPVLFLITLFMIPFCYVMCSLGYNRTVFVSLLYVFILQIMIVKFILLSTSYQYSVCAITNAEIRQFKALNELEVERQKRLAVDDAITYKMESEQDPRFSWVYLQHHLEQVMRSDELLVDKLQIVRIMLWVPYYDREMKCIKILQGSKEASVRPLGKGVKISEEKIKFNNPKKVYEFYYENLLAVFGCINRLGDLEYCDKMCLLLYEFLEELTKIYEKEETDKSTKNYVMTVSGIMNAVLSSSMEKGEGFRDYVLNNVVCKKVRDIQITLYFLFCEYLYRINDGVIRLGDIEKIGKIKMWKKKMEESTKIIEEDIKIEMRKVNEIKKEFETYALSWNIWMEKTTVSSGYCYCYYEEAYRTFARKVGTDIGSPIAYVMRFV